MIKVIRKYHKWLMTFVGIQFLFWSITGLYMVSMDIHYIHGESLVKKQEAKLAVKQVHYSISELAVKYPQANHIVLTQNMGQPVYIFTNGDQGKLTLDAKTGLLIPTVDETKAKEIAQYYYAGSHEIASIRLISSKSTMPAELSSRHLPFWQVTFDNIAKPTFYISQQTGQVVAKRHDYWRLFDWMWRFHIMDYDDGENVANWFLFLVATLGLLAAIAGAVLTYKHVIAYKKKRRINAVV